LFKVKILRMSRKAPLGSNSSAINNNGIQSNGLGSASGMYGNHTSGNLGGFKHSRSMLNPNATPSGNIAIPHSASSIAMQVPQSQSISSAH
jgi:hypothetical protein